VGDQQHRDLAIAVQPLQDLHDLDAGAAVEVAGRLVGQDQLGSLTSARAIATRCCWPPDSWFGVWCARSPRPTAVSSSSAFWCRCGARRPRPL
jgi:hypothetical protein